MLSDSKYYNDQSIEDIHRMIKNAIKERKEIDFFHKSFLRPLEICLKEQNQIGNLPIGLKQVVKEDISSNTYLLANFQSIADIPPEQQKAYEYLSSENYDNMISLFKPGKQQKGLKLAICITMYSEDSIALKNTLSGIGNNIFQFTKMGIPADRIGIFLFIDGIEAIHPSIVDYISELQRQSGILLQEQTKFMTPLELLKSLENYDTFQDDYNINLNQFIFDDADFKDRQNRRFKNRKKEYENAKQLLLQIQKLQKDKTLTFEELNQVCKRYFYIVARKQRQRQYAEDQDEAKNHTNEFLVREFGQNISTCRMLIEKALGLAKADYLKYLQLRQSIALLNCFQLEVKKQERLMRQRLIPQRQDDEIIKMNLFFITKYKNRGKLSSHNWFFNGVCKQLRPQYSIILDAGLIPDKMAIYKMVSYMEQNQKTGGVCGYMALRVQGLEKEDEFKNHEIGCFSETFHSIFDIQKAQRMEYHFAHLIDKPFQSLFNFIHVLPGAFSGYKMKALQPENEEESELLREYFKSINEITYSRFVTKTDYNPCKVILRVLMPDSLYFCCFEKGQNSEEQLLENENVYLAEDRTLCLGIHENGFDLQYLPDAYSTIDPMKTLHGMMGQRKRWINGSYFGFEKVKRNFKCCRDTSSCFIYFQMLFLHLLNILSFISPAIFLFTIQIAVISFNEQVLTPNFGKIGQSWLSTVGLTVKFVYLMLLLSLAYYSIHMTSKNKYFIPFIYLTSTILGIVAFLVFGMLGYQLSKFQISKKEFPYSGQVLSYLIIAVIGLHIICLLFYVISLCRFQILADVLLSVFSFIFYSPTYMTILNIYAISRIDDISWGTKGLEEKQKNESEEEKRKSWKRIKIIHLGKFIFWNGVIGELFYNLAKDLTYRFYISFIIIIILLFILFLKTIFGIFYLIQYKYKSKSRIEPNQINMTEDITDKYFNEVKFSLYENLKQNIEQIRKNCLKQEVDFTKVILMNGTQFIKASKDKKKKNFRQRFQSIHNSNIRSKLNTESKSSIKSNLKSQIKYGKSTGNQPQIVDHYPNSAINIQINSSNNTNPDLSFRKKSKRGQRQQKSEVKKKSKEKKTKERMKGKSQIHSKKKSHLKESNNSGQNLIKDRIIQSQSPPKIKRNLYQQRFDSLSVINEVQNDHSAKFRRQIAIIDRSKMIEKMIEEDHMSKNEVQ